MSSIEELNAQSLKGHLQVSVLRLPAKLPSDSCCCSTLS